MNVAQIKGGGAKAGVADNVLMNDDDRTSGESSPINVPIISNSIVSSPTSITPNALMATHSLGDPSSLQSSDTLTLAAMYHSSRRSSDNSSEKNNQQLLPSTQDLLPPPPIYSAIGKDHGQSLQSEQKNSAQPALVSTNTLNDSWNSLVNSSFLKSSNSAAMATNPPIINIFQSQQRGRCTKKKQGNIDWSTMNNYSMEEMEEPPCPNVPVPEGDGDSTSALDDSEYPHVRRRSDFKIDEDQEKSSSPGAYGCNPAELPAPPHKKKRRGGLRMSMDESSNDPTKLQVPTNDTPAIPLPCSSDTAFDIYVPNNAYQSSKMSSTFDDDINLSRSRRQEELSPTPRRNSLRLEDLEDEQESIEERQSELVRRKIQRLLLIRHCTKCSIRSISLPPNVNAIDTGYFCPVTSRCAEGKALCAHIKTCKLANCTYKKCLTTREVLGHYINCKDRGCKICGPVRTRDKRRRNQMKEDIEWKHVNMLL